MAPFEEVLVSLDQSVRNLFGRLFGLGGEIPEVVYRGHRGDERVVADCERAEGPRDVSCRVIIRGVRVPTE